MIGRLSEVPIPQDTGLFRLMRREVVGAVLQHSESTRFLQGVFAWVGYRQTAMLYDRQNRAAGTSKWPIRKMMRLALDALTTFSTAPLIVPFLRRRFFTARIDFPSSDSCAMERGRWIQRCVGSFPPFFVWPPLRNFLSMGGAALYLGKISVQTSRRPLYFVAEIVRSSPIRSSMACEDIYHENDNLFTTAQFGEFYERTRLLHYPLTRKDPDECV